MRAFPLLGQKKAGRGIRFHGPLKAKTEFVRLVTITAAAEDNQSGAG